MPDQDDDRALLERCLGGDAGAWNEFLARYRSLLERAVRFTFLRSVYRIPHADVENVVQDLLARLYERGGRRLRSFEEREEVRRLDALLDSLGPLQRTVLKMFYYDGLSYRQISQTLGIPVQTLGSLITRARGRLREMLQPAEGSVPGETDS
jgi:RNA polymerase sigma-70 factor (ECF subfamily)